MLPGKFVSLLLGALPDIPNAEVFFVGADDALADAPLAELLPRFVPGTDELARGLTGTSPAFLNAKEPVRSQMVIDATYIGPCAAGQSPGDIILPDGKIVKMPQPAAR